DHGMIDRSLLDGENLPDGLCIGRVGAQAVYGFGRERDQLARRQELGRFVDRARARRDDTTAHRAAALPCASSAGHLLEFKPLQSTFCGGRENRGRLVNARLEVRAAGPPRAANRARSGGSAAAKPQAWGLSTSTGALMSEFLFTSESVSEGHPDKVADQISDAVLDAILEQDPTGRVAAETLVSTGLVVMAGEITADANVNYARVARETIRRIGYNDPELRFDADG